MRPVRQDDRPEVRRLAAQVRAEYAEVERASTLLDQATRGLLIAVAYDPDKRRRLARIYAPPVVALSGALAGLASALISVQVAHWCWFILTVLVLLVVMRLAYIRRGVERADLAREQSLRLHRGIQPSIDRLTAAILAVRLPGERTVDQS